MQVKSEDVKPYNVKSLDDAIIEQALAILTKRMFSSERIALTSPDNVKHYLSLKIGGLEYEMFSVLFLNAQHEIIAFKEMFRGTVSQASVYPREVVREALALNASAVILSHNHPSGSMQPSSADRALTQTLKSALALIDVRVLDHIIVSAGNSYSMAERGDI